MGKIVLAIVNKESLATISEKTKRKNNGRKRKPVARENKIQSIAGLEVHSSVLINVYVLSILLDLQELEILKERRKYKNFPVPKDRIISIFLL